MFSLDDKILLIQLLCAFFCVFVPLVFLAVLSLQGNLTFSILPLRQQSQKQLLSSTVIPDNIPRASAHKDAPPTSSTHQKDVDALVLDRLLEDSSTDKSLNHKNLDAAINKQIELRAMEFVREYEEQNGRDVEDVSMYYAGYDYKSDGPDGFRAIEVKGKASSGKVYITANEWKTAKEFEDSYFLYVVEDTLKAHPRLRIIQNPYKRLQVQVNRVQYILPRETYYSSSEVITFS